ncbi:MAG: biotin-dependent carboxyltransferase [Deltaproteobacteria bacterium]|nr:biotin-dependent carboxyltransferase [Deltaproteobacteria bacterium]
MAIVATMEVMDPGPLCTVQDLGRYGFGRYGVPPSGALDSFALRAANILVGNRECEAGLEITLMGLKIKALTGVVVAIGGGDLQPAINGKSIETWRSYGMRKGDFLHFKSPKNGCRAYLAVGGGILVQSVLGSRSTNLSSRFGGYEGTPLKKKDVLSSDSPETHVKFDGSALPPEWRPLYGKDWVLRVLWGPQDMDFPEKSREAFLDSPFKVSPQSDRTGIRLSGHLIHRRPSLGESIISEGVAPGTIQVPGDGQPIIILSETITGGYRKIATVIGADLPFLGQIKPGDQVRFDPVDLDCALGAIEQLEETFRRLRERISAEFPMT